MKMAVKKIDSLVNFKRVIQHPSMKKILSLITLISAFILSHQTMASAAIKTATKADDYKIKLRKTKITQPVLVNAISEKDMIYLKNSFFTKSAKQSLSLFQKETFGDEEMDLDVVFLKIEKRVIYQIISPKDVVNFHFDHLTDAVIKYISIIKSTYGIKALNAQERSLLQMNFFGLSQAIKKANEMNLTVQSDHFDKLHDLMLSQSTTLFYASHKEFKYADIFWTAYFLHNLNYPMDLTARHLKALSQRIVTFNYPKKYKLYGEKIARHSIITAQKLNKTSADDLEVLYNWAKGDEKDKEQLQTIQKSYLKQLQVVGDSEKVKEVKRDLAYGLLIQESKHVLSHPLSLFKYIQFLIGYVFVAWPLEVILLVVAGLIFTIQSSSVLTKEEERKANKWYKKIWMMFTKAYLGSNVPFFSKLAASLILFGIGLYFNSAKNFVESLISNF